MMNPERDRLNGKTGGEKLSAREEKLAPTEDSFPVRGVRGKAVLKTGFRDCQEETIPPGKGGGRGSAIVVAIFLAAP